MALGIIIGIICGFIGMAMGDKKGHSGLGFVLGFFLGIIGLLIVAALSPTKERLQAQTSELTDRVAAELAARGVDNDYAASGAPGHAVAA